jgi:hypothetical protein
MKRPIPIKNPPSYINLSLLATLRSEFIHF